jgi:penicillin-binding protein activator
MRRLIPLLCLALAACGPAKTVSRIDANSVTDLSGRWNDTDSRLVANALIEQSLQSGWHRRFRESRGGKNPSVMVGAFRNKSTEYITILTFTRDLERAFVNSGDVDVIAGKGERDELRAERQDQQQNAAADTRAKVAMEQGAHFMLQGDVQTIEDMEGRERIMYYQIDATLINLETNQKTWVGQHKIKKYMRTR